MGRVKSMWCWRHTAELEMHIKETSQRYLRRCFPKLYYCLLSWRTSKERKTGNPLMPNLLTLNTLWLPPWRIFLILQCTIQILAQDLTHHVQLTYLNNHATPCDVAAHPLISSLHVDLLKWFEQQYWFLISFENILLCLSNTVPHPASISSYIYFEP